MSRIKTNSPDTFGIEVSLSVDPARLARAVALMSPAHLTEFLSVFCAEVPDSTLATASTRSLTAHTSNAARVSRVLSALGEAARS